jgi:hypothetical protein
MMSGSSIPTDNQRSVARLTPLPPKDHAAVQTVEQGQTVLAGYGMKWQNLQQADTGEWQYSCVIPADVNATTFRRYDAKHLDPVEAVRAVVHQAENDR